MVALARGWHLPLPTGWARAESKPAHDFPPAALADFHSAIHWRAAERRTRFRAGLTELEMASLHGVDRRCCHRRGTTWSEYFHPCTRCSPRV